MTRPQLNDLKRKIDNFESKDQLKAMLEDESPQLAILVSDEPEVSSIQKLLNQNLQEIENLANSNQDMKKEMVEIITNFEEQKDIYEVNQKQNDELEQKFKDQSIS